MRDCPELPYARKSVELRKSKSGSDPQTPKPQSRSQTPNEPDPNFKRNGTATLSEEAQLVSSNESPVKVVDPALPAMCQESTPGTPRMQLFFVLGAVQTLPVWILADSGSVRNLIDEAVYNRLPFKPPIRDPGDVQVIGGNGEPLELKCSLSP